MTGSHLPHKEKNNNKGNNLARGNNNATTYNRHIKVRAYDPQSVTLSIHLPLLNHQEKNDQIISEK